MTISFRCTGCNQSYKVPEEAAGRSTRCRKCGNMMQIPASSGAEAGYTASAPAAAVLAVAQAPAVAGVASRQRSKLPVALAGGVAVLALSIVTFVAARYFLGGNSLGVAERYLPDNPDAIGVADVEKFMTSKLYTEMEKSLPKQNSQIVQPEKIRRVTGAGSANGKSAVTVYEMKSTVSLAELQEAIKKSQLWIKEFKEEKVGRTRSTATRAGRASVWSTAGSNPRTSPTRPSACPKAS